MKRQSGCEEEGWSGDQQSGCRRGDVEMNAGQRTVDHGDGEEKTEQKSMSSDDEVSNHRRRQTDQIQSRPSCFLPKLRASYQNTVVLVLCFCREILT